MPDLFTAYALVTSTSGLDQGAVAAEVFDLVIYDEVAKSSGRELVG